jgi:hypothetical protein
MEYNGEAISEQEWDEAEEQESNNEFDEDKLLDQFEDCILDGE